MKQALTFYDKDLNPIFDQAETEETTPAELRVLNSDFYSDWQARMIDEAKSVPQAAMNPDYLCDRRMEASYGFGYYIRDAIIEECSYYLGSIFLDLNLEAPEMAIITNTVNINGIINNTMAQINATSNVFDIRSYYPFTDMPYNTGLIADFIIAPIYTAIKAALIPIVGNYTHKLLGITNAARERIKAALEIAAANVVNVYAPAGYFGVGVDQNDDIVVDGSCTADGNAHIFCIESGAEIDKPAMLGTGCNGHCHPAEETPKSATTTFEVYDKDGKKTTRELTADQEAVIIEALINNDKATIESYGLF